MSPPIDIDALINEIVRDATDAALEEESELQCSVLRRCRQILARHRAREDLLLQPNPHLDAAKQSRSYWAEAPTEIVQLLWPSLMRGEQPVFAVISLLTTSTAHTVLAPVPYLQMRQGAKGLQSSLWLNAEFCGDLEADADLYESAARSLSHALTNISYSVWIEDEPDTGWLALAHASSKPVYIPDVRDLPSGREANAESVATKEERYLGMASVLFVPLYSEPPTKKTPAPAVLMLWSPVAGRWDRRLTNLSRMQPEAPAYRVDDEILGTAFLAELWEQFEWVELVAARDFSSRRRFDLQGINLVLALMRWRDQQNEIVRKAMGEFLHHTHDPIKALTHSAAESASVRSAVKDLVSDRRGFVDVVLGGNLNLTQTNFTVSVSGQDSVVLSLAEARDQPNVLDGIIPADLTVRLDRSAARQVIASPAGNIIKYASALTAIRVDISKRFATFKYFETPNDQSREAFDGAEGFKRYYAVRRGQSVAPILVESQHEASQGLGLWLNRMLESRTGAAARLYISPDWKDWSTSVVFKLEGAEESR